MAGWASPVLTLLYLTLVVTPLLMCVVAAAVRVARRIGPYDEVEDRAPRTFHVPERMTAAVARIRLTSVPAGPSSVRRRHACPDCAERIRVEARVCRFCGFRL